MARIQVSVLIFPGKPGINPYAVGADSSGKDGTLSSLLAGHYESLNGLDGHASCLCDILLK